MVLHNRVDKRILKEKIANDTTPRTTLSFYKYVIIESPATLRDHLFKMWNELGVLGRIYVAHEGVNAQLSLPTSNLENFRNTVDQDARFKGVPFKIAVEDDGKSFYKLAVKVREKIVADGLDDSAFDVTNVGNHLTAKQFNQALESPDTIVVDMRNHYESEIGHFEGAICPDVDTFKEELPIVVDMLKDKKDKKILMYCTGGVRCEKASAYLKHHGFQDVNQLYGGIIDYARQIKDENLPNKFAGKNFVFDDRMGETIGNQVIAHCHQCGNAWDTHVNCANLDCNLLFLQCPTCAEKMKGCCSDECMEIVQLPEEEQIKLRKGKNKTDTLMVFKKGRYSNFKSNVKK
ncbi:MAG: rhodanese-related sulfurtransferase [Bacteroidota bacterium]